ncbi:signal peptidase I [Candidatus Epulonipiscium fishelsonii]|uniref:Signal peptidase I n=1 Tax=Candidatus Epulonipiscium fishelsonii TaxID=77094 RepID=A0ACC8XGV8_9FIRM|nr:signal peptidase I [Epulopiscium sp. SCG-B05WGA-EpuloA1]ONI42782.1 signal peptidase I [Epulopiscium sp. SCG-B11WGA-EpuloA1]ONI47724.1 signal peptidase I [Epulopiscium sp. SCG-C06WGA-EpuloA1]
MKLAKDILEFFKEPIMAVLVALIISHFLISHITIPTGSMISTINIGDHMIVSHIPFYHRNPDRGEIIVFKYGGDNLIKRVIGLPGEIIDVQQGKVYINGEELAETEYIRFPDTTYPQIVSFPYTIPEGHYFVMGDNRENSADSRSFGAISRDVITAVGGYRIYPFNNIGVVD